MAIIKEMDQKAWNEWVATRPPIIQELCKKFPPNRLYKLKPDGNRVTIYSYSEDGTLMVNVDSEYNEIMFERQVFGIKPENLEECDLPGKNEITGALLTLNRDIDAFIDGIKEE